MGKQVSIDRSELEKLLKSHEIVTTINHALGKQRLKSLLRLAENTIHRESMMDKGPESFEFELGS